MPPSRPLPEGTAESNFRAPLSTLKAGPGGHGASLFAAERGRDGRQGAAAAPELVGEVRMLRWSVYRAIRVEGIMAMVKVISTLFISADGVAEIDPDWHFPYFDENMGRAVGEDYDTADVLLIGRVTYDSFAGAWPDREAAGGEDALFAKQLGDVRKVIVSRQPLEFSWRNCELIKGDLVEAVTELKAEAGIKGILIPGSISVVQQLLAAGLVDELRLLVHPVAARKGRRLFDDGDTAYHLKMTATEAFPTGVIRVIYSPTQAPAKVDYDAVKDQVPGDK
jgi:dihydrofolate reductase